MKILIVTQYFYPENFRVNTLARELVVRGHKVTVLTGYPQYPYGKIYEGYGFHIPYDTEWNGVHVERVRVLPRGKSAIGLLLNCITFVSEGNKWVRRCKEKYDAVYVFEVSPVTVGLPALKYKKKFGTPIFFNVQDLWPENVIEVLGISNKLAISVINRIVDKIYKNSDKILCASKSFVENIVDRGVIREKVVYWPQFCEDPDFENMKKPDCYNENFLNIVFTGNIGYAQGLDFLVDVAEKMKERSIRWYIVGDGRARQELEAKVQKKGLESIVLFLGKMSEQEANAYVRYADAAYLSFTNNKLFNMTIPAKLQTYLACDTPIIGVVSGETKEIIENARAGSVCEYDCQMAVSVLEKFLAKKKKGIRFETHGRKYFLSNFKKELLIEKLEEIIGEEK